MKKLIPLDERKFMRVKNAKYRCLCALCRAPREMRYNKKLSTSNYIQIAVLSAFLTWCLFPLMSFNAAFIVFIVWPIFELINKFLYRRELPCPYCGFDATWYRRDVKIARKKVSDFWNASNELPKPPGDVIPEERRTVH